MSRTSAEAAPPGSWRILAPALVAWPATAAMIAIPGSARWVALGACGLGAAGVALARAARTRWLLPAVALGCALLVLLGARVDALEAVRADSSLATATDRSETVHLQVELRAFPHQGVDAAGRRTGWVPAYASSPSGRVPVVVWFDGETASGAAVDTWAPGGCLRVRGTLVTLGAASSAVYGVRAAELDAGEPACGDARLAGLGASAARLRSGLRAVAERVPGAELVPGFAVGDTSLVPPELDADMRTSSLTHLVAVSGANCALVVTAVTTVAGWVSLGRRTRILLAALALGSFVAVVGPDPSLQRAAVMASVLLLSAYGGKRATALASLGCAIAVLLVADPWQAVQPGFALSVSATAGILLGVPALSRLLVRTLSMPRWMRLPVAVALAAQIACGPLLLLVQDGVPAAGTLANVLAAPAAPWGTGFGLLALLAVPVSGELAAALVWCAAFPARWIAATAEVTASLPAARWPWPGGWRGAALLAAVEAALMLAYWILRDRLGERLFRRAGPTGGTDGRGLRGVGPRETLSGPGPWGSGRPRPQAVRIAVALLVSAAAGVFLGPTVVAPVTERLGTPSDWSVVACDVGQGDALLLRDPADSATVMLVDTGDDPGALTACLDRFGVARISLLVLTHDDRDHVGALDAVLDRVDGALIAPDSREDAGERPVRAALERAHVPTEVGVAGTSGGLAARGGLTWEVLAPPRGARPADTNAASEVLLVHAGALSVLLLADTGEPEQRALARSGAALDVDVLKVAHHGSADHDAALFAAASPEVALISVGGDNSYGHPAAQTVAELDAIGARVIRTDRSGTIAVSGAPGAMRVWSERRSSAAGEAAPADPPGRAPPER